MTWQQWLYKAVLKLNASQSPSARSDAEILLRYVTGSTRAHILAFGETWLTKEQYFQLEILLLRRKHGEPIAYITGECEFWSLPLHISTDTMIPRPDTECLVQCVLDLISPDYAKVLDLGTGCGAIALALASERPKWQITGIDIIAGAVDLARVNALRLKLKNTKFYKGNWFQPVIAKRYHIIVSNPPYIKYNDPHLILGDIRFEPYTALIAKQNGLEDLAAICYSASKYLIPGGWLVLEHGWQQGAAVRSLLMKAGFNQIVTLRDYGGNERVGLGQWLRKKNIYK